MNPILKLSRSKIYVLVGALIIICAIIGTYAFAGDWELGDFNSKGVSTTKEEPVAQVPTKTVTETQLITTTYTKVPAAPTAKFDVARKIAYISRHDGTTMDFKYMADHLQLENVDYYDSSKWFDHYTLPRSKYMSLIENGFRDKVCSEYDAVFISDALSEGWAFITGENNKCKNVVFVVTNRFDFTCYPEDRKDFHKDFNNALNRQDKHRMRVVVNNPFEIEYMKNRGINFPEGDYHPLIRPFGSTNIEANPEDVEQQPCVVTARMQLEIVLRNLVKEKTGIECKVLEERYGGPKTLNKYQSIQVHLPYQVSVMKMWENVAYGTLLAVPSPKLLMELYDENKFGHAILEAKTVAGENWADYVDFYLKEWLECFVQFDSWDELKIILEKRTYQKSINTCRDKMMDMRDQNLAEWKKFLELLGK